jgi:hypothetical protein
VLNFRLRLYARCAKHPRYNPEKDGQGGIKGGCADCSQLLKIYEAAFSVKFAERIYRESREARP